MEMDFFDESINSTQKSFNFVENVKNADQTFNETNDSDKIWRRRVSRGLNNTYFNLQFTKKIMTLRFVKSNLWSF